MNTPPVPPPFTPQQDKHLSDAVEKTIAEKIAYCKRILTIVSSILVPVLGFLGYLGVGQLRQNFNSEQSRLITGAVEKQTADIQEKTRKATETFIEKQKQTQDIFDRQFEDDRRRLRDEVSATVRDAAQAGVKNRLQLEAFVEEQKHIIADKKSEIEREIHGAVMTRESLRVAEAAAVQSVAELKAQQERARATSDTISALLKETVLQCDQLTNQRKDLDMQIAEMKPRMEAIRSILADQKAAEIFSKLQQDFGRIRSLEVRTTFIFPPTNGEQPAAEFVPFDGLWINKAGAPFLQLYPLSNKTTRIDRGDAVHMVYRFELFAPHEMSIEGQPISELANVDAIDLYFSSSPEAFSDPQVSDPRAVYAKYIGSFQKSLGELTGIRVQVLLNGYSSFDKLLPVADLNIPQLPLDGFETKWEKTLSLPVAELFSSPEEVYSKQFSVTSSRRTGTASAIAEASAR